MQTIAQHTRVNPTGRIQRLLDFNARLLRTEVSANAFRDWGLDIERQLVDVPGRILPIENIIFGQKRWVEHTFVVFSFISVSIH